MNKEQQIEEIKRVLISVYGRIRTGGEDFINNRQAEALYKAGYRKTFTSDKQKAYKEGYKKGFNAKLTSDFVSYAQKQAVKEFAEKIKNEVYPFLQAEMYEQKHFIAGDSEIDKLFENQNVGILKAQDVLSKWFNVKIDELLKEYEK